MKKQKQPHTGQCGVKAKVCSSGSAEVTAAVEARQEGLTNRRQRRQALRQLQREAAGVVTTELVMARDAMVDHRLQLLVASWVRDIPQTRPLCLGCSYEWRSLDDVVPPVAFVATMPYGVEQPSAVILSAVCANCIGRADLPDIIDESLQKICPGWRLIEPHTGPGGVQ